MIWDGAFAAPLGMKQDQLAPLTVTHASVRYAFQALTRHDFQMAVRFNEQHNKEWLQSSGVTEMSLSADLDRLLLCIKPVGPPLLAILSSEKKAEPEPVVSESVFLPSMPSAVPPVPPLPGQCLQPVLPPLPFVAFSGSPFSQGLYSMNPEKKAEPVLSGSVSLPSIPNAVSLASLLPRSIPAKQAVEHAQYKDAASTESLVAAPAAPPPSAIFAPPSSAVLDIQAELAATQRLGGKTLVKLQKP